MEHYKNLGGDSNVAAYELGHNYIVVRFGDGSNYLYNYASAGAHNIEQMKTLAIGGQGLNSYINRKVRKGYARKF